MNAITRTPSAASAPFLLSGAFLLVAGLYSLAAAADNGPAGARSVTDEITVTARKREEALQNVPLSVTALTASDLQDLQIRAVEDVARFTPGLSLPKAFGRSTDRPVIRGQGNVLAGVQFGVESGVAYFIDSVYYPGDLSSLDLNNIERVEVVRGPQSALYGRNTYSGAINFVTKAPGDELSGDVRARYGQDDDIELNAVARGALVDGLLAGSIAGRYYSWDGEWRNTVTGKTVGDEESKSLSGTLDFTPHSNLLISSRLSYQEDRDGTRPFFLQPAESNNCSPGTRSNASWPGATGSTNTSQYFCGEIKAPGSTVSLNDGLALPGWPGPGDLVPGVLPTMPGIPFPPFNIPPNNAYNPNNGLVFSGVERDILNFSVRSEWDINASGWTLYSSFAYRDEDRKTGSDSDHSQINLLTQPVAPNVRTPRNNPTCTFCASDLKEAEDYSVEVRLESPVAERLRWRIGAFFYDQDIDTKLLTFQNTGGGPLLDSENIRNWALFGDVQYDFTDRLGATFELRYFDEKKSLKEFVFNNYDDNILRDAPATPGGVRFDDSVSFSEFAPRLTLNWQATDEVLLYASYAQGYKPGGLIGADGLTVFPDPRTDYDQESSDTYELGLKGVWLDDRLSSNIAVFFIDSKDIQLTTPLSTSSGTLTSIVTNQGAGEVFGVEIDVRLAVTENLALGASYALADTKFTKGCDADQYILTSGGGLLLDSEVCTGNNVNGQGNGSIVGNQFPLSSKNQVSAYADYRRGLFDQTEFFTNIGFSWEDKKPVQVHNLAYVPSAFILDARIGLETERWTVALYGRNLTDEDAPNMATRWLQDPIVFGAAGLPSAATSLTLLGLDPTACTVAPGTPPICSTSFPRAFFADLRRGRTFGLDVAWRFGN